MICGGRHPRPGSHAPCNHATFLWRPTFEQRRIGEVPVSSQSGFAAYTVAAETNLAMRSRLRDLRKVVAWRPNRW